MKSCDVAIIKLLFEYIDFCINWIWLIFYALSINVSTEVK